LFQRRAGDDASFTAAAPGVDTAGDPLQPGNAIGIAERCTAAHLGDILGRMERIALLIMPAQPLGQQPADRGFAGPRNPHDDKDLGQDHGAVVSIMPVH
jgi:hypothetical protein